MFLVGVISQPNCRAHHRLLALPGVCDFEPEQSAQKNMQKLWENVEKTQKMGKHV